MPATTKNTATRGTTRRSRQESRAAIVAAATDLVRERSFSELSVGEVMERAGIERTIFYRHFDDLGDLLLQAGGESIQDLFDAQVDLSSTRDGSGTRPGAIRDAVWPVVAFYEHHGPLLRALDEAAASEPGIAAAQEALRKRFDELVAEFLGELPQFSNVPAAQVREIAHAVNLMNVAYLLDAFGREPRLSADEAVQTLTTVWTALIFGPRPSDIGA
jgi:TetR/AcrR family transcriptional regulator, ethionamide resistance regulator